jgi:hypothetical protein
MILWLALILILFGCGSDPGGDADELIITCNNAGSGQQRCFIVQGPFSTGTCASSEGGAGIGVEGAEPTCSPGNISVTPEGDNP